MKTVVVRHKQIGPDQETGTAPDVVRIVSSRYNKPADFGSKLVVLAIARKVPHLFKVCGADDSIGAPLNFSVALYISRSFSARGFKASF